MRLPLYAFLVFLVESAVLWSLKPFLPCVPSQNGLFAEPPQQQSATPRTVAQASPEARRRLGTGTACASFNR